MSSGTCPRSTDLLHALHGELEAEARRDLEQHVRACPTCRAEQAGLRALVAELQELPPAAWARPRPAGARRLALWVPAAALLLGLGSWLAWWADPSAERLAPELAAMGRAGSSPRPTSAVAQETGMAPQRGRVSALPAAPAEAHWLVAALEPDGSWPDELLGPSRRQASQHALALLALSGTDVDARAVGRAADWLVARLRADGSLSAGLADGSTDQALAAAALLGAARRTGRSDLDDAAQRAVDHLLALLEQGGGAMVTHPAQLAWVVEALEAALGAGRQDVAPILRRVCTGRVSVRPGCQVAALRRDALGGPQPSPQLGEVFRASRATLAAAGW